jgi:putative ABC transport system permease protein
VTALQRKLWRDLGQLRGQVIAIALVVIGGIGTMVMAQSNYGALADTRALYYAEYRFADVFARVARAPLTVLEAVRAIPGVREAEPRVNEIVNLELAGFDEPVTGQIVSLPRPGDPGLNRLFLRAGRLPAAAQEAVVGEVFAEAHGLNPGDTLVAILNGRRQQLTVVGIGLSPEFIYQIRPGDVFPDFERFGVLWMAYEPVATAFDMDGAFNDLSISLTRDANEADVIDALDALLARYGGAGAHGRDLQLSHRYLDEELGQLEVMTRLFTAVFLGVVAFLLNVVVGRLVAAQREQIAVLKAYGYSRLEVSRHYAGLVLMMASAGVVPGLALGAWLGRGLADIYMGFYRFPYLSWSLQPSVVALALGFAVVAAAIGAAAALHRGYRLPAAEAMRPEAPPAFRRSLTERIGLGALLDPAARMILRNLGRRPLRTLLSVVGIAFAIGILVMSRFQRGAIEEMIDVQFGFAQRDDFAVTFTEPASSRAADELAAIPGVRTVEPFRNAAVRLRNGHREYRTALQGLRDGADLKRVLTADLAPASLPADGVVLTDYLADLLDVRPGDSIDVEFLEGHRRTLAIPVAGTVHEYLGVGAYARVDVVNRLLGEGGALSGAWLAADRAQRATVTSELRARPRIAAVTDRAATVQSFRDTMAESILTFTLIATLMAGSIAVGVVYNASRITLEERGRELASLRVLGYTRGEVRALLLGELFTLTFAALLPGFLVGLGMVWLLVQGFSSDLYRVPLVVSPPGFAISGLVALAATALSGWLVRRRLDRLDLVAALKLKE